MVSIGIDVGGTGIQIGVVDEKGTILEKSSIVFRLEDGWQQQIHDMACDENFNNGVEESNFIRSYNARIQSFREQRMLPDNIRSMIAGVAERLSIESKSERRDDL